MDPLRLLADACADVSQTHVQITFCRSVPLAPLPPPAAAAKAKASSAADAAATAAAASDSASADDSSPDAATVCVFVRRHAFGPTVIITKKVCVRRHVMRATTFVMPADAVLVFNMVVAGLLVDERISELPAHPTQPAAFGVRLRVNDQAYAEFNTKLNPYNWRQTILESLTGTGPLHANAKPIFLCMFPAAT